MLVLSCLAAATACSGEEKGRDGDGSGGRTEEPDGGVGGAIQYGGAGGADGASDCGPAPDVRGPFGKEALLGAAAACAAHATCDFGQRAEALGRAVTAYVEEPSEERREAARAAWIEAMDAWAFAVPFDFGPVAPVGVDKYHGRGIGVYVHPWPSPNLCEVSKQLVSRFYAENGLTRVPPGARGLFALEVILFDELNDTGCAAASTTAQSWAELSEEERLRARLDYAKVIVDDVFRRSRELNGVWAKDGEDFTSTLVAGEGYGSQQEALTVVAWSLLYVYEKVRDGKVAPLAGLGTTLPNYETRFAQVDREAILANLRSFRALFEGCAGPESLGFDDWLTEIGETGLRDEILTALEAAEAAAAELPPLHEASEEQMLELYELLKVLTDLLKGNLIGSASPINVVLPASAASDTD